MALQGAKWPSLLAVGLMGMLVVGEVGILVNPTHAVAGEGPGIDQPLPSQVAAANPNADPALVEWLRGWEQGVMAGMDPSTRQFELTALLAKSDLSVADLYELGRAAGRVAADPSDPRLRFKSRAEFPFSLRALTQATQQAPNLVRGSPEARELASLILRNESCLWQLREGVVLEQQARLVMQLLDPPDQAQARLSLAGALQLQNRTNEALLELMDVAADPALNLTPREQSHLDWQLGLQLHNSSRHIEAVAYLHAAAEAEGFKHAQDAFIREISSLVSLKRFDDAEHRLAVFSTRYPDAQSHIKSLQLELRFARGPRHRH